MKKFKLIATLLPLSFIGVLACSSKIENDNTTVNDASSRVKNEATAANDVSKLPSFAMMDVNGNSVDLNSFKGKKVFVNLWATWCPPCRAEMPSIEALAKKVDKDKAVFVLLSLDENFDLAKQFATAKNLQVPVYYPAANLPPLFVTEGIPATFIFDQNGNLVKQNNGAEDYDTEEYVSLLNNN